MLEEALQDAKYPILFGQLKSFLKKHSTPKSSNTIREYLGQIEGLVRLKINTRSEKRLGLKAGDYYYLVHKNGYDPYEGFNKLFLEIVELFYKGLIINNNGYFPMDVETDVEYRIYESLVFSGKTFEEVNNLLDLLKLYNGDSIDDPSDGSLPFSTLRKDRLTPEILTKTLLDLKTGIVKKWITEINAIKKKLFEQYNNGELAASIEESIS